MKRLLTAPLILCLLGGLWPASRAMADNPQSLSQRLGNIYKTQRSAQQDYQERYNVAKLILQYELQQTVERIRLIGPEANGKAVKALITLNPGREKEIRQMWQLYALKVFDKSVSFITPHLAAAYAKTFTIDFLNVWLMHTQLPVHEKIGRAWIDFINTDKEFASQFQDTVQDSIRSAEKGQNLITAMSNNPRMKRFQAEFDIYLNARLTPAEQKDWAEFRAMQEAMDAKTPEFDRHMQDQMMKESKYTLLSLGLDIVTLSAELARDYASRGIIISARSEGAHQAE